MLLRTFYLVRSVPNSFTLCTLSNSVGRGGNPSVNYYLLLEDFLMSFDQCSNKQKKSNMSLGIILFLYSITRKIIHSLPWPMTYLVLDSWPPQQCQLSVPSCGYRVGLISKKTFLVTSIYLFHYCASISCRRVSVQIKGLVVDELIIIHHFCVQSICPHMHSQQG